MAPPQVVGLYQWLRVKPGASLPTLGGNVFAAAELDEITKHSAENKRIFVRVERLRVRKIEPDVKDLASVWFSNGEDYDGLVHFIKFIQSQGEPGAHNPLQITLNYLLQAPEIAANHLEDAFKVLFASWIALTPRESYAWYEDDDTQEKLSNHQEIHLALGRLVTEHYQQEARELFRLVTNPIGLIPLFAEHYDNPQRIAAFILCLLEQDAIPAKRDEIADKIIQSGLLHEFFLYHASFLGNVNNPVKQLYDLLNTFDVANLLVERVSQISVMTGVDQKNAEGAERAGSLSSKRYFEPYTLSGTQPTKGLTIVDIYPIVFDSVPHPDAFKSFYSLFEQRFLLKMLGYYDTSSNADAKQMLEQQLNNLSTQGGSQQELVQLLNALARESKESLLRVVAELLQEQTINALIESGNFAVFHLTPFKAGLIKKLNLAQVQRYIASITPNDPPFEQLILLRTMLGQLEYRSGVEAVTALIFDKILNVLMSNPHLVDHHFIEALQSVAATPNGKALLQQHAVLLAEQLNQSIQGVITSDAGLTPDTSQDLHDAWRDLAKKLSVLKEISPDLASDFPHDKYAFYVSLVKAVIVHQGDHFNLQATLTNFFPVVEEQEWLLHYPEGSISEHERTLVELLAAIDNEGLRLQAIQQLEAPPIKRLNWLEQQYNDQTLIELASKQGNKALIQYLLKENKLNQAAVSHLLKTAIAAKQWVTVKVLIYLTGANNKPNLDSVSEALVAATQANQLVALLTPDLSPLQRQGVFQNKRKKIEHPKIEIPADPAQLLTLLVAHGEEETIKQLIQLSPPEFLQSLATRVNVTDYSGRTFTDEAPISAFGFALWAWDSQMWNMILDSLQKAFNAGYGEADAIRQALWQQYQEIQTVGVSYTLNGKITHDEGHFDFQPLINALNTYTQKANSWSAAAQEKYWCYKVGLLQRLVPAHVAQHYCEKKAFNRNKPFRHTTLSRSLQFYNGISEKNESWFPLTRDNRLGFDFAICNYTAEFAGTDTYAFSAPSLWAAFQNLGGLTALLEASIQDVVALGERLATPLQRQYLGTTECLDNCTI